MTIPAATCRHYYPVERARGCNAPGARIAMRDCAGCAAYDPDCCASETAITEPDRFRWRMWSSGVRELSDHQK